MDEKPDTGRSRLGAYLKKSRQDRSMSLREVETATGKDVSNAYISQLESGKIAKPSPNVLFSLSSALNVPYEELMSRAGYITPDNTESDTADKINGKTYAIGNLSADEEVQLLDFLSFIRSKKR